MSNFDNSAHSQKAHQELVEAKSKEFYAYTQWVKEAQENYDKHLKGFVEYKAAINSEIAAIKQ